MNLASKIGNVLVNGYAQGVDDVKLNQNIKVLTMKLADCKYLTKSYAVKDVVESVQIELNYNNYIEASDLDVVKIPEKNRTLFYETADRLESVMQTLGIEKKDKSLFGGMFG